MEFEFEVDADSLVFCRAIVNEMINRYQIAHSDAIKMINRQWAGMPFVGDDLIYHETPTYWANRIYDNYEKCLRDGTAELPREVLIQRRQEVAKRLHLKGDSKLGPLRPFPGVKSDE